MKLSITCALLALIAPLTIASEEDQKPVLVSYPDGTPASIIEEAKSAIIKAGGIITHEFHLIQGFAANAPAKILDTIQALEAHAGVQIEEDKVVTINRS